MNVPGRFEALRVRAATGETRTPTGISDVFGGGIAEAFATGGDARSVATSAASSGHAVAQAGFVAGGTTWLETRAFSQTSRDFHEDGVARATARFGGIEGASGSGMIATGAFRPEEAELLAALAGNEDVTSIVLDRGVESAKLLGVAALSQSGNDAGEVLAFSSVFDLVVDVTRTSFLQDAYIGFLDPDFAPVGIASLRVFVEAEGATLLDVIFDDALLAGAFLDDNVLELGSLMAADGMLNLHVAFEVMTDAPGQAFRSDFVVGGLAPEPSTGLLVGLGLLLLGRRRRS